jgi:cyanate lyase
MITREAATEHILSAKRVKGMTFEEIATQLGLREVWLGTKLIGMMVGDGMTVATPTSRWHAPSMLATY